MREYPHDPDSNAVERAHHSAVRRLVRRDRFTEEYLAARTPEFFRFNARQAMDCAARAHALGELLGAIREFLEEACASASQLLAANGPLDPYTYVKLLSAADLCRDTALLDNLADLDRSRYTDPEITFDESAYAAAAAHADLVAARGDGLVDRIAAALADLKPRQADRAVRAEFGTALEIEHAIARADRDAFRLALERRSQAYARKFENPTLRNMPDGLLDLWGCGLTRRAQILGIAPGEGTPYMPIELVRG